MESIINKDTVFLDKLAKLNNFNKPYSGYVHQGLVMKDIFPKQNSSMILQDLYINCRDKDGLLQGEEFVKDHYYKRIKTTVLRYDDENPFVFISIDSLGKIYVGNTRSINNEPEYVIKYPDQQYNYYGISVIDIFRDMRETLPGTVFRCDNNNPAYSVIMEYVDDNTIRFVTGDEVLSKVVLGTIPTEERMYKKEIDMKVFLEDILTRYIIYGSNINNQ